MVVFHQPRFKAFQAKYVLFPVVGDVARNRWIYLALHWSKLSSEEERYKLICFNIALKIPCYT